MYRLYLMTCYFRMARAFFKKGYGEPNFVNLSNVTIYRFFWVNIIVLHLLGCKSAVREELTDQHGVATSPKPPNNIVAVTDDRGLQRPVLPFALYQQKVRSIFAEETKSRWMRSIDVGEYVVELFETKEHRPKYYVFVTAGLGYVETKGGAGWELLAEALEPKEGVAEVLVQVGKSIKEEFQNYGDYHSLALDQPIRGFVGFGFRPNFRVQVVKGYTLQWYKVLPLYEDEIEAIDDQNSTQWLEGDMSDRRSQLERWSPVFHE